ncbi:MAG: 3-deoxy-manno-octulosonate cytidylyltransferase [Pseudomonadota bacterium]
MKTSYNIIIPARYASSRLPAKPLIKIAGKTMLQHTYERACLSQAEEVIIATDDKRILESTKQYTENVILTSNNHQSGTDRLAEVVDKLSWHDNTIVVNVQGDEPLILAEHIQQVADMLNNQQDAGISTLCYRIQSIDDLFNPNIVKVVCDINGYALYFSRAPIPWNRDEFGELKTKPTELPENTAYFRHIGMYAYRAKTLRKYQSLKSIEIEQTESLEQLRAMYYGIKIVVGETQKQPGHGVDVEADLKRVERLLQQ